MIVGSGVDIVKVSRIKDLVSKKQYSFLNKIFTEYEMDYIEGKNNNVRTISGIFASKEAISKVLGAGIGKVNWKDIEIFHSPKGKPIVRLYAEGLRLCKKLGINSIHLSISHENEYAIAFAVGEGEKYKKPISIPDSVKGLLPKRDKDSHKGTFGRVGIMAGSTGMTGAAYLSTMAALRAGSGLVYSIAPKGIGEILSIKLIEAIIKPVEDDNTGCFTLNSFGEIKRIIEDLDVLAIGPGIGVDEQRMELVEKILLGYKKPVILDADGINCVSRGNLDIFLNRKGVTIITPHLGELSRLLKVDIKEIQKNPLKYSKYASNKYNIIVVLKGANTIVSNSNGETYINTSGNPGMATAGSGDVLTGIIASLVGQGVKPYEAAMLGVYFHGLAGDLAKSDKGEYGMIARDILDNIPYALCQTEDPYDI